MVFLLFYLEETPLILKKIKQHNKVQSTFHNQFLIVKYFYCLFHLFAISYPFPYYLNYNILKIKKDYVATSYSPRRSPTKYHQR